MLSGPEHCRPFSHSISLPGEINDIKKILEALRGLDIAPPLKRRMLDEALWLFAFVTGNRQGQFRGRWMSENVKRGTGEKIQRDHVYSRKALLNELLGPSPDLDRIAARAQCCVVVTADEHTRLNRSKSDGGEKYRIAGVCVYDMLDGKQVAAELEWSP